MQREAQEKLLDEMFSPVSGAVLPASIEERLELYTKRIELEEKGTPYKITKHKFLNYRQFFLHVKNKQHFFKAYALNYSTLPRKKAQGRIECKIDNVYHFNRDEVKFITLSYFNQIASKSYKTVLELLDNPLSFKEELSLRRTIVDEEYDLTPIIVMEEIPDGRLEIYLDAKVYEDTKEKLIIF